MAVELHIGHKLKKNGKEDLTCPVYLDAEGLLAHLAVIGQSGSGKSYALGRIIEELVYRTSARFIILDPNSDFIKLSELCKNQDTAFCDAWLKLKICIVTNHKKTDFKPAGKNAELLPVFIDWDELSFLQKLDYIGISAGNNPKEMNVLRLLESMINLNKRYTVEYDQPGLGVLASSVKRIWEIKNKKPISESELILPPNYSLENFDLDALNVLYTRLLSLTQADIWGTGTKEPSLQQMIKDMVADKTGAADILVVDLPSIASAEGQMHVCNTTIGTLWEAAIDARARGLKSAGDKYDQIPVFLLVDEAHSLAPVGNISGITGKVAEGLLRIVAEGRKYGISLILATQKPSRIRLEILSQCDNLDLFKLSNQLDLATIVQTFGLVPPKMILKAPTFKNGECLLGGSFVPAPVMVKGALRRTEHGGKKLGLRWLAPRSSAPK